MKLHDLTGKISLVTGAGSGLGRAICEALAENGSRVVCADINETWAEDTAERLRSYGSEPLPIGVDVSNSIDVKLMFRRLLDHFGRLDILFNNAGITTRPSRLHEMPLEYWAKTISTDLTAVFLCMQEAIKLMLPQKSGSIINISSVGGLIGMPRKGNYSAAKAGVIALTKSAAVDYGPDGIRVNAIAPGLFAGTALGKTAGYTDKELEEQNNVIAKITPLRRVAGPMEIKGLAIYLASDASSFVTGATFVIDGGFTIQI